MKRIGWARLELPVQVPLPSGLVLGVNQQRSNSRNVCSLCRAHQRILEQSFAKTDEVIALAREAGVPGQACPDVASALTEIARHADRARPPVVLVTGSLYLVGDALAANGQSAG